jgi:CelD/BcsL family acetyltransferase involved in cellulose biosynthesis
MLEIDVIRAREAFLGLEPEWDMLVNSMPRPSPFLTHAWIATWLNHYADGHEPSIVVARRHGRIVGALPLMTTRTTWLRTLEFIGGSHSALADILLAPEEQEAGAALVQRARRIPHDAAKLYGLPSASQLERLTGRGLHFLERAEAPVLDLAESWETVYTSKTSKRTRSLHRRRRRQLAKLGPLEVGVARNPAELPAALEEAFRLHRMRRADLPDASGFTTVRGMAFHRDVIRHLASRDIARIVLMRLSGEAIAFHYFLALAGRMYVHCLGFDPAYARFSPGLLTTLDAIGFADREGLSRVEFLGGAERYKVELADRFEPMHQGIGWGATRRGSIAVACARGAITARQRVKKSPRVHRAYVKYLATVRRIWRRTGA